MAEGQHVLQIATILGGLGGLTLVVVSVCTILCWEMGVGLVGEGWVRSVPGDSHSSSPHAGATSRG